jgi:phosphate:Na+ symporter
MPNLLPDLDQQDDGYGPAERGAFWKGSLAIASAIDHFLVDVIRRDAGSENLDIALQQQARLEMIRALVDTLHDFSGAVDGFSQVPPLAFNLSESLRTIILSLSEATEGEGTEDFDLLIDLTADRSELLNRIRRALVSTQLSSDEERRLLLLATSLFERAVWLVRRLAVALRPSQNEDRAGLDRAPA